MLLKIFFLIALLSITIVQVAPDGTYVNGTPTIAPDGSYVGGKVIITPDGKYIGDGSND